MTLPLLETHPDQLGGIDPTAVAGCVDDCLACARACAEACGKCEDSCRQLRDHLVGTA